MTETGLIVTLGRSHESAALEIESLKRELYARNCELADTEEMLRQERSKSAQFDMGLRELRGILDPLHRALQMVYGEMDAMGVRGGASASPDMRVSAVWDDWKKKLPSGEAKAIDALLLHGKLKTDQLRIHIGCATRTATNIVSALKSKGLIVKDGAYCSLKEL